MTREQTKVLNYECFMRQRFCNSESWISTANDSEEILATTLDHELIAKFAKEFIKDIIEYGLNNISDKEKITMSLKDFLYIRRVLEEYMRYLHNPDHYPDIKAIQNFLGDISSGGGFECLSTAIYKKVYKVDLPSKIEKMIDDGVFEHPLYPSYYKENE